MNENALIESPGEQPQEAGSQHEMFKGLDGAGDIGHGGGGTRIPTTHIIAVLVALVGAGSIYAMRQMGMRSGMDFEARPVAFESEYSPEDHERFQRVLAELAMAEVLVQIPPERAGSNPFFVGVSRGDTREQENAELAAERERKRLEEEARREAEARAAQIAQALDGLRLGTIITGRVPAATIDDEIVRVGDTVREILTIVEITSRSVVLEADGERHEITPRSHGPGSRR